VLDGLLDGARAAVEGHYLVAAEREAVDHVAAHAAEANEAKLHTFYMSPWVLSIS
jgi:hypothetical protein